MYQKNDNHRQLKRQALEYLARSFDDFYEHTIVTDENGIITWISEAYYRFLDLKVSPIGLHITKIIPNSYLPNVIANGKPVFSDLLFLQNQWVVVSVIPLKNHSGKIVGGFGFVATKNIAPLLAKYERLQKQLKEAHNKLEQKHRSRYRLSQIVGNSDSIKAVKKQVRQAARYDISVLLTGETGTGKELFAHALHDLSSRNSGPFVSLNVAAIPENLIEAEFFGVAPGAYTGATKEGRKGKIELADGGTLFMDEIGDIPIHLQSKLLRALQEKEFEPVGSNELKKANIRIVAATSRNLTTMMENGLFRPDLYYRLNGFPIHLPPLRERLPDIEALSEKFIDESSDQLGLPVKELSTSALQLLSHQPWHGNIRELRNVIERACVLSNSSIIDAASLEPLLSRLESKSPSHQVPLTQTNFPNPSSPRPLEEVVQEAERKAIIETLLYTHGRKTEAAKILGISRASLYGKIQKLGI